MGKSNPPQGLNLVDQLTMAGFQKRATRDLLNEQLGANRPDQVTPYGSVTWENLGDNQWRQTTALDPEVQRALDAQQTLQASRSEAAQEMFGGALEDMSGPLGWEALSANPVDTGAEARQRAEDAIYGRAMSRLEPVMEQKRDALYSQLWNQGLRPGDAAWDTAMANLGREETDARQTAINEAIMGGGAEASRTFGLDMSRRQQALAEQLKRRGQRLSEMEAVMTGQQAQLPEFGGFAQRGAGRAPDYTGMLEAEQASEWDRFNAQQAQQQGLWAGGAGLATSLLPFIMSDRRLKSDIVHIGHTLGGQRIYEYTIFGRRERGVMAQESPGAAVAMHPSGYLMVNYGEIY